MVTVIIPSRNEQFLRKTVRDVLDKAKGEIEVLVVLEGYWPDAKDVINDLRVHYVHHGTPKGLRGAVMAAVAVAKGKYIMKIDAHCMFGEGYDEILAADCEPDWVVVPRRYGLDAEKWEIEKRTDDKYPIDYMYIACPSDRNNGDLGGEVWQEKNRDPKLKDKPIDDLMTFQGSCWFMEKDYFHKLGLFDEENYGTFRKEPQEISFKCWLSGGRVVRNKKTWYAHLYKGTRYKRGYSLARSDWDKGDEYNKKWLTNSAWDKQTKNLRWLIDKFNPPGWENHKWDKSNPIEEAKPQSNPRVYQNIVIDNNDMGQNPKKKDSKFWNKGKWDNFIAPLLPSDYKGQTFVEVGCNAGLFLRLAKEKGYKRIVGVEKSRTACRVGEQYRDNLKLDYKILCRTVGEDFNFDELPVADVTLLSTVHYYFDLVDWFKYIDKLRNKTRYCLIVSRSVDKDRHWQPSGEFADIRHYFRDWLETGAVNDISQRGDPHPRELWSLMFKSNLIRMDIGDIYIKNERHRTWVEDYKKMDEAKRELADEIAKNDSIYMENTSYFKQWVERKKNDRSWPEEKIKAFVQDKINLMFDVKYNGLREPLLVKVWGQICDGGHRLAILRAMGEKSVIVRAV